MSEQRSFASVIKSLRAVRSVFVLMFLLGLGAANFPAPASAVTLSEDDIVVVDFSANAVFLIDPITGSATTVVSGAPFIGPSGVAVEEDGNILVTDQTVNALFRVDPDTGSVTTLASGAPFVRIFKVVVEADENILIADAAAGGGAVDPTAAIYRIDPTAGAVTTVASGAPFANPVDLAVEADGDILVLDVGDVSRVFRIDASAGSVTTIASGPPFSSSLRGLAVEEDGSILVVDISLKKVFRIDPDTGSVTTLVTFIGSRRPTGIAVETDGDILVVDLDGPTYRVDPVSGSFTTLASGAPFINPVDIAVVDLPVVDDEGPVTTDTTADPNPVAIGSNVDLTANVDDTGLGDSDIASAEYSLDGGTTWSPMLMNATDGTFDEVNEDVKVSFNAPPEAGIFGLCVRGTDDSSNVGDPECIMLVVYDPSGGFVTGGGWIDSPAGAYIPDDALTGKANFGFVSKYKKGATVPTGSTEFQFKAGNLNFHSSSYDFLVITMNSTNAQFKGFGTVNGGLAPNGMEFRFMLWASDDSPDTFRIRIWYELAEEEVVYDNVSEQELGGGSIVIHTKGKK